MFCPECGTTCNEGDRFCDGCGKELISISRPNIQQPSKLFQTAFQAPSQKKPLPIVLIAIYLALIGGLVAIASSIGGIALSSLPKEVETFGSMIPNAPFGGSFIKGAFVAELLFIISLLSIAASYGLWNFTQWGRFLTVILSAIYFVFCIINLFITNAGGVLFSIFTMVTCAAIVVYLIMSDVSSRFSD